ncbi:MAG: FkbM family methyltransferase [Actinobacteria bacterium]|nr:FkbM family methyltransferase [Actinomycetota bacterium]
MLYQRWRHPTCHIIALEPNPDAFALLRRNVDDNGLAEVELHPHAAGATSAQVELHIPRGEDVYGVTDNSLRASTERPPAGVASVAITVPCVRLSDVLPARVDLPKLDVEGAESEIVEELVASGGISAVDRVVLEHTVGDSMAELTAIVSRLEAAGFHVRLSWPRTGSNDVLVRARRAASDDQRPVTH